MKGRVDMLDWSIAVYVLVMVLLAIFLGYGSRLDAIRWKRF